MSAPTWALSPTGSVSCGANGEGTTLRRGEYPKGLRSSKRWPDSHQARLNAKTASGIANQAGQSWPDTHQARPTANGEEREDEPYQPPGYPSRRSAGRLRLTRWLLHRHLALSIPGEPTVVRYSDKDRFRHSSR